MGKIKITSETNEAILKLGKFIRETEHPRVEFPFIEREGIAKGAAGADTLCDVAAAVLTAFATAPDVWKERILYFSNVKAKATPVKH